MHVLCVYRVVQYPTWPESRAPPGDIRDVLDGTLMNTEPWKNLLTESPYNIFVQGISDAVQLTRWPMRSYTPYVFFLLNLPPWVRHRIGATWMVAVFPENSKNDQLYFEEVNKQLQKLSTTGIRVKDGSLENIEVSVYCVLYILHYCNIYITLLSYICYTNVIYTYCTTIIYTLQQYNIFTILL